jgi:hypothetical protein
MEEENHLMATNRPRLVTRGMLWRRSRLHIIKPDNSIRTVQPKGEHSKKGNSHGGGAYHDPSSSCPSVICCLKAWLLGCRALMELNFARTAAAER